MAFFYFPIQSKLFTQCLPAYKCNAFSSYESLHFSVLSQFECKAFSYPGHLSQRSLLERTCGDSSMENKSPGGHGHPQKSSSQATNWQELRPVGCGFYIGQKEQGKQSQELGPNCRSQVRTQTKKKKKNPMVGHGSPWALITPNNIYSARNPKLSFLTRRFSYEGVTFCISSSGLMFRNSSLPLKPL